MGFPYSSFLVPLAAPCLSNQVNSYLNNRLTRSALKQHSKQFFQLWPLDTGILNIGILCKLVMVPVPEANATVIVMYSSFLLLQLGLNNFSSSRLFALLGFSGGASGMFSRGCLNCFPYIFPIFVLKPFALLFNPFPVGCTYAGPGGRLER